MNSRINDLVRSIHCRDDDYGCKIIAIWGMAGIGKSTIAFTLYNRLCHKFKDGGCVLLKSQLKWSMALPL